MNKSSPMFAAALGLALTAGSAYAQVGQHASGSARPSCPAPVTDGATPNAPAVPGSSSAQFSALLQDWDRAGFSAPSKPAQGLVYGRNGRVTSGGEYHAMVSLIQSAIRDSREGRDREALATIARARTGSRHKAGARFTFSSTDQELRPKAGCPN